MIKGITDKKETQLFVGGKLAIGEKVNGRNYPTKLDHFVFKVKNEKGEWVVDKSLTEKHGKTKTVSIFFLSDEIEEIFPTNLNYFLKSGLACRGDGETATRRIEQEVGADFKTAKWLETPKKIQCGLNCPDFKQRKCKANGRLLFLLADTDMMSLGTCWKFDTTSMKTIQNIISALEFIKKTTRGLLKGIKMDLVVTPETTSYLDGNTRKTSNFYTVSVRFPFTDMKHLRLRMGEEIENSKLLEGFKVLPPSEADELQEFKEAEDVEFTEEKDGRNELIAQIYDSFVFDDIEKTNLMTKILEYNEEDFEECKEKILKKIAFFNEVLKNAIEELQEPQVKMQNVIRVHKKEMRGTVADAIKWLERHEEARNLKPELA